MPDKTQNQDSLFQKGNIYIKPSQRYEDIKSSASAFLFVGAAITVFSLLCWLNLIPLPMYGAFGLFFRFIMTLMGLGALMGSLIGYKAADKMKSHVTKEEQATAELIGWFLSAYDKEQIDGTILEEFPDISEDEKNLKRFELIQDYLILNKDLPHQAYVEAVCEEIFQRLYE